MDIEQQFKEYLLGKLQEMREKTEETVNQIQITVDDYFSGVCRFNVTAYTRPTSHTGPCDTVDMAIAATIKALGVESIAERAENLRNTAARFIQEAAELEARS